MALAGDLRTYLLSVDDISELVDTRIFPVLIPQGESLPAVVYQKVSTPRLVSHDGPVGLAHPRYQVTCWAETYSDAETLANEVRYALDGYRGTMGSTEVQGCFIVDEGDIPELSPESDSERVYGKRLDIEIWFEEATS